MRIKHIALVCQSEKKSDRFYGTLLGLKKIAIKTVPRHLARAIFHVDAEFKILHYADENMHFEIFVDEGRPYNDTCIEHVCLEVPRIDAFIETCRKMGVKNYRIPRNGGDLFFVRDDTGNLFELKESETTG